MNRVLKFVRSVLDEVLSFPVFVCILLLPVSCSLDEDENTPFQNTVCWVCGMAIILVCMFILLLGLAASFMLIYAIFRYCVIPTIAIVAVVSLVYLLFCNKEKSENRTDSNADIGDL